MKLSERPVSRTALSWLLVAQLAVLLPLALQLPGWLLLISACCWGWRFALLKGFTSPLGRWGRASLVGLCIALVILLEGHLTSLKGFALLLALGFIFKLVELRNLRDAYAVLFVAVLLLAVNLLFSQSLITSLLTATSLFFLLCAWVGLSQLGVGLYWRQSLKWAAGLYLLALPLTFILFLLVPRIPPLWQISTDSGQAQTGLSDSMSPGDLSKLARSDQLAFRVSFSAQPPPQHQLYWRTVVMSKFDGRRWWQDNAYWFERASLTIQGWAKPLNVTNSRWISWPESPKSWDSQTEEAPAYQLIVEPTQQHWLPALAYPRTQQKDVGLVADQRLIYRHPLQQRIQYQVHSARQSELSAAEQQLLALHSRHYLTYPKAINPKFQRYIQALWQQHSSVTELVKELLSTIQQQNYVYTLEPPQLGQHAVDEFWFDTRRGFCAHYASALALALRIAGTPSRVIGGYQGGEWDAEAEFLQVRQYDAHAWVEYWQPQQGWIRVDPTAAIAPHRIEQSFAQSLRANQTEGSELIASWRLSPFQGLTWLRVYWDQLEYLWHKRVLNYKAEQQYELLKRWFGQVNWTYLMTGLILGISLFLSLITLWRSAPWRRQQRSPEVALYLKLLKALEKYQLSCAPSSPPRALLDQLDSLPADKQRLLEEFLDSFQAVSYQKELSHTAQAQHLSRMAQLLKQL